LAKHSWLKDKGSNRKNPNDQINYWKAGWEIILGRGHKLSLLPATNLISQQSGQSNPYELDVDWKQDAKETIQKSEHLPVEWIITDHYGIDHQWHKYIRPYTKRIMVIDDLANRQLDCDLLLDQTFGREEEAYRSKVPDHCQLLVGSDYTLLRPEFEKLRPKALDKRADYNGIKRLLISMGATDPDNVTERVLQSLAQIAWETKPLVDVILSKHAPHLIMIEELAKRHPLKITLHTEVTNMAEFILMADLAIGAAGATSWERCCLGLPTLATQNAGNQSEIIKQLAKSKALISLGECQDLKPLVIAEHIERLTSSKNQYQEMVQAGINVCDGEGVKRVVDKML
jgi:UDP-2,4-diacetamido-2,4,6-trideoxy-beta-L-altropyranose hydrolase